MTKLTAKVTTHFCKKNYFGASEFVVKNTRYGLKKDANFTLVIFRFYYKDDTYDYCDDESVILV